MRHVVLEIDPRTAGCAVYPSGSSDRCCANQVLVAASASRSAVRIAEEAPADSNGTSSDDSRSHDCLSELRPSKPCQRKILFRVWLTARSTSVKVVGRLRRGHDLSTANVGGALAVLDGHQILCSLENGYMNLLTVSVPMTRQSRIRLVTLSRVSTRIHGGGVGSGDGSCIAISRKVSATK